ncbi:CoA transferase, partial [bacterium]|nr:CoA transferase [bacterium]
EQAFEDPSILATRMVKTVDHPTAGPIQMLNKPWHLSRSGGDSQLPPPPLGWHTDEVLKDAGFSEEEIRTFRAEKLIEGR